jgi:hypothetical protein
MPSNDVDGAALAKMVERILEKYLPGSANKDAADMLPNSGMTLVQQPVEGAASPASLELEPYSDRTADRPKVIDGHRSQSPTFGSRDPGLTNAGSGCDVRLAHSCLNSDCAEDRANLQVVQRRIVPHAPSLAVARRRAGKAPATAGKGAPASIGR